MDNFISRKQLEVRHSRTYEMKEKLKELGCEWDGIARAWIAPSIEVKELCYQILEEREASDTSPQTRYFGNCGWHNVDYDELEECIKSIGKPVELIKAESIAYTPSREEIEKIVGSENVLRYWHPNLIEEVAEILASGEQNKLAIDDRLHEKGWKTRQISLLMEVVDFFRDHPPNPALDEVATVVTMPSVKGIDAIDPIELDGSIGVICDTDKKPVAFTVSFPYSSQMVNRVKWLPGRKWNPARKRWEVPINSKYGSQDTLDTFPHFQRSPKAKELEGLK